MEGAKGTRAGGWRLKAEGWRLEARRLEACGCRLEDGRLEEAFWHQKWPRVLGISANVQDRGRPLELKWRLKGTPFGQILSAKGLEREWGGRVGGGEFEVTQNLGEF